MKLGFFFKTNQSLQIETKEMNQKDLLNWEKKGALIRERGQHILIAPDKLVRFDLVPFKR